jgi:hypothetical protein
MLSATASLGWLYLWDVEDSINHIDPFVYADDVNIQVYPPFHILTIGRRIVGYRNDQFHCP